MKKVLNLFLAISICFLNINKPLFADDEKMVQIIDIQTVEELIEDLEVKVNFIERHIGDQAEQLVLLNDTASYARLLQNISATVEFFGGVGLMLPGFTYGIAAGAYAFDDIIKGVRVWKSLNAYMVLVRNLPVSKGVATTAGCLGVVLMVGIPIMVGGAAGAVLPFYLALENEYAADSDHRRRFTFTTLPIDNKQRRDIDNNDRIQIMGQKGSIALIVASDTNLKKYANAIGNRYNGLREDADFVYQTKIDEIPIRFWRFGNDQVDLTQLDKMRTESQLDWYKAEKEDLVKLLFELKMIKSLLERALNGDLEQPLNLDPDGVDKFYRDQAIEDKINELNEQQLSPEIEENEAEDSTEEGPGHK